MGNRIDKFSVNAPQGGYGVFPYQVVTPVINPPMPIIPAQMACVPPQGYFPPPPPCNPLSSINKNVTITHIGDKEQAVTDYKQDFSISSLSSAVVAMSQSLISLSGQVVDQVIALGETSGTAYPGEKGAINAQSITIINSAIQNILNSMATKSDLNQYAKTEDVTESITQVINAIPTEVSGLHGYNELVKHDTISSTISSITTGIIDSTIFETAVTNTISSTASSVVTNIIKNNLMTDDFDDILSAVIELNKKI